MNADHVLSSPPVVREKKIKRKKSMMKKKYEEKQETKTTTSFTDKLTIGENLLRLAKSSDDNVFQSVLPIQVEDKVGQFDAEIKTIMDRNRIVISWPQGHTLVQHFKKNNRNKIVAVYVGKTDENNIATGPGMFIVFADKSQSKVRNESLGYWIKDTMTHGKFECLERVELGKFDRGKVEGVLYRKGHVIQRGLFLEGTDFVESGDVKRIDESVAQAHVAIRDANAMVRETHDLFRALRQKVYKIYGYDTINMEIVREEFQEDMIKKNVIVEDEDSVTPRTTTKKKKKRGRPRLSSVSESKKRKLSKDSSNQNSNIRVSKRNQEKLIREKKEYTNYLENLFLCQKIIRKQRVDLGRLKALSVQYLRGGQDMSKERQEQLRSNIYTLSCRSENKKAVSGALTFLQMLIHESKNGDT